MNRNKKINGCSLFSAPEDDRKPCGWPGCGEEGLHKAPLSREEMKTYHWLCLGHVRKYNATWNYYRGMTESEVEADVRDDTVWNRPTWRWGSAGGVNGFKTDCFKDDFGLFSNAETSNRDNPPLGWKVSAPEAMALAILDLRPPVTTKSVKTRYKELVKRHHPDANGGDKESEEKFKQISEAYNVIIECLSSRPAKV